MLHRGVPQEPNGWRNPSPVPVDLVDRDLIRLLDPDFVSCDTDGTIGVVEIVDFAGNGEVDLAIFEGASPGLVGDDDLARAAKTIDPNSSVVILLVDNWRTAGFLLGVRRGGSPIMSAGYVSQDGLLEALESDDASRVKPVGMRSPIPD